MIPKDQKRNEEKQIPIHANEQGPLSPYIIHLSRDEESTYTKKEIDHLAEQFIIDIDGEEELGPPESDLVLDFNELTDQLREQETQVGEFPFDYQKQTQNNTRQEPSKVTPFSYKPKKESLETSFDTALLETKQPELPYKTEEEFILPQKKEIIHEIQFNASQNNEDTFEIEPPKQETTTRSKRSTLLTITSFFVIACLLVLPVHAIQQVYAAKSNETSITDAGKNAIDSFMRGTEALQDERLNIASDDFARASENFSEAEKSLKEINVALTTIASVLPKTGRTYDSAHGLLTAGKELSDVASSLTQAAQEIASRDSFTATTKLTLLSSYINNSLPHIEAAEEALKHVDSNAVPIEYKATVDELKARIPALSNSLHEFITFSDTLKTVLGGDQKMRYLVVFQNNTELRPTGGFPGSFAEIDVLNGEIVNINIPEGGTYDVQGQLSQFVHAPKPLGLINPRWEFHDSNWFPDFPTSAKKMLWFYEKAGGPTVDGVIAINATLMPKLLEITGPIDMPEYDRIIDSENFLFETQKIVEYEYESFTDENSTRAEDAPKQFIGDLAPKILEHVKEGDFETTLAMFDLLGKGLIEKDVQMYFRDNDLQSDVQNLGWAGVLKQTKGDYLMVVNTNLGGGKTDSIIDQYVHLQSEIQPDGSIINTVTIRKEHKGLENAIFEGANNVDYIRLYVPKGSELLSAEGFEIPPDTLFEESEVPLADDEDLSLLITDMQVIHPSKTDSWVENGKTVFGNWIQTKPGETEEVTFQYKLPMTLESETREYTWLEKMKNKLGFKNLETHTILLQKQSGVVNRKTSISVTFPDKKTTIWSSDGTDVSFTNERDHFVRFLLENEVE